MTTPRSFSPTNCSNLTLLSMESSNVDCKTVGFFSKSVKKSVKRGVRVLRARSARASHARRACEAREKKPYF